MSDAKRQRRVVIVAVILVTAVLVHVFARYFLERREQCVHVSLKCSSNNVSAVINGGDALTLETAERDGRRIGIYTFHSFERPYARTWFRNFNIIDIAGQRPIRLSQKVGNILEQSEGWSYRAESGLFHDGAPGMRAISLFKDIEAEDFEVSLELIDPVDSGIMIRAADVGNGLVFVVRPQLNDAFFFELKDGVPGPILLLGEFGMLTVGRECIRVAGLTAWLIVKAFIFLGILWVIVIQLPDVDVCFDRIWSFLHGRRSQLLIIGFMFVLTFVSLGLVACYAHDGIPHITDESAYLFQAKIFAGGKLTAPVPAHPDFFMVENVVMKGGKWFGKYPPLYPFFLMLGVKAGVPWIVNPLLGALAALGTFLVAWKIYDSFPCGLISWVLMLSSPFFLILGSSMMSHTMALLLSVVCIYSVVCIVEDNALQRAAVAGACVGAMLLVRPYTAAIVGSISALFLTFKAWPAMGFRRLVAIAATMLAGALPFVCLYMAWNAHCNGEGFFSLNLYTAYHGTDVLGFGSDKGYGWMKTWGSWGHSPAKGCRSVYNFLDYTSSFLMGWPFQLSFAFVGLPLLFGKKKHMLWLLFSVFIALIVGHMFYWATQHISHGARYWFSGVAGLMILSAGGIMMFVPDQSQGGSSGAGVRGVSIKRLFIAIVVAGLIAYNLFCYLPERLSECHNYANMSAGLKRTVERMNLHKALIFIKTENYIFNDGFFMNDPFMKSDLIFARDLGERNGELISEYPGYAVFKWDKRVLKRCFKDEQASN